MAFNNLANTRKKLLVDKKLNAVYFGGSITAGANATDQDKTSWRGLSTQYLRNKFPDVEINSVNASSGGTGTGYGLFRMNEEVMPHNPDLAFIEFSMNDCYQLYNVDNSLRYYESIIKRINDNNLNTDIIIVYTGDRGIYRKGWNNIFKAHDKMVCHHNLLSVDVLKALKEDSQINNRDEDDYFSDWVHPTDVGHSVYADCVNKFLDAQLEAAANSEPTQNKISSTISNNLILGKTTRVKACDMEQSGNRGFIPEVCYNGTRTIYTSCKAGDEWTFEFEGTHLSLWAHSWKDEEASGKVECYIDGAYLCTGSFRSNCHSLIHVTYANALKPGRHVATILNCEDAKCTIEEFFIAE